MLKSRMLSAFKIPSIIVPITSVFDFCMLFRCSAR